MLNVGNIKYFTIFQMLFFILSLIICYLFFDINVFKSYFYGSLLMIVANTIFISRLFFKNKLSDPVNEVLILFVCELLKLVILAVGTIIIVKNINVIMLPYFLGLVILQIAMWLMPIFLAK